LASELLCPHDQSLKTFEVEKQGHHQELLLGKKQYSLFLTAAGNSGL